MAALNRKAEPVCEHVMVNSYDNRFPDDVSFSLVKQ